MVLLYVVFHYVRVSIYVKGGKLYHLKSFPLDNVPAYL